MDNETLKKNILKSMAKLADKGRKTVGHLSLAQSFEIDPHLLNVHLRMLKDDKLLRYKGKKKGQYTYSITKKGCIEALSMEQGEMLITEKTKHLGIPTTEKETTISPPPSEYATESGSSVSGSLGPSPELGLKASYTQKNTKNVKFGKNKKFPKKKMEIV